MNKITKILRTFQDDKSYHSGTLYIDFKNQIHMMKVENDFQHSVHRVKKNLLQNKSINSKKKKTTKVQHLARNKQK